MSGYCPDCGNTFCICDKETKLTYPLRVRISELESRLSEANRLLERGVISFNNYIEKMPSYSSIKLKWPNMVEEYFENYKQEGSRDDN